MMKQTRFTLKMLAIAGMTALSLAACKKEVNEKDNPPQPERREWDKVQIRFHDGHLHGSSFHGSPGLPDSLSIASFIDHTLQIDQNGKITDLKGRELDDTVKLAGGYDKGLEHSSVKSMEIKFFKGGREITNSMITPEGRKTLQVFFLPQGKGLNQENTYKQTGPFYFTYRDTIPRTPQEQAIPFRSYLSDSYPAGSPFEGKYDKRYGAIGLRGYFHIFQTEGATPNKEGITKPAVFPVRVVVASGINKEGRGLEWFDASVLKLAATKIVFDKTLQFKVFVNHSDGETEDGYDNYLKAFAREFNVKDAKTVEKLLFGSSPEGSGYWL